MKTLSRGWERIGSGRRSGVLAPLFSLYSEQSLGIGDLADLKLLADWCVRTGNSIMQLLPMNEVGGDFCPYDSVSSFALEPAYLSVGGNAPAGPGRPAWRDNRCVAKVDANQVAELRRQFPAGGPRVDYRVKEAKLGLLRETYLEDQGRDSEELADYRRNNAWWLDDFALFKVLKAHHGGRAWYEWPDVYRRRDAAGLRSFQAEHRVEIGFQAWVQWLLYRQFREVKAYCGAQGVLIMGDLPVLIARDSSDVWAHPEFFKLEFAAGAPPDMFSTRGQRWGMPTYDWEQISGGGCRYLAEKLRYAEEFYDVLRVDHVVGFFRIWSIPFEEPLENAGRNGVFDPPDERVWEAHGRRILSLMVRSTKMLLCGEDLGAIPPSCPRVLQELGIPGVDVQRWAKDWHGTRDFLPPGEYRFLSVAALSTHDTTNWNFWWEKESTRREKEDFWKYLEISGPVSETAGKEITCAALRFILKTRSVFSIQMITDWLNLADVFTGDRSRVRINTPGTTNAENWSFVVPISLERLLDHEVCRRIASLIAESGRAPRG